MPRVTVLTAARNSAQYLRETITSVLAQSYTDFEYVIVDDASTDTTPWVVASVAQQDSRIRLVRRETAGGPFVAANDGLRIATGELIIRTDSDDLSLQGRIGAQVAFLDAHPELSACVTLTRALDDVRPVRKIPLTPGSIKWVLCLHCILVHSALCIRREALVAEGGYRELQLAQDFRLFCDLAREGRIAVVPELHVLFRRQTTRASVSRRAEQRRFTIDVLTQHLEALTGSVWVDEEVEAIYSVGRTEHFPLERGLAALDRWDRAWRADGSLTRGERVEIARESASTRRSFIRGNLRAQPFGVLARLPVLIRPAPRGTSLR